MHSVANLATLQMPLVTFSLQKSQKPFLRPAGTAVRVRCLAVLLTVLLCTLAVCTHLSLSLCSSRDGDEQHSQLNTDTMLLLYFYMQV